MNSSVYIYIYIYIYIYLLFVVYFSRQQRNIYVNTNSKGNQSWNKNTDIEIEKSCFLCRVKIPYQQFLTFFSFIMNIFRSSHSQMFFKIGALENFAIFWIKKSLQHRCFHVNIAKILRTVYLQNFSCDCLCIILKVIKQLFCRAYF